MEKKQEARLSTVGSQFRQRAGLPKRKNDKPADATDDAPELERTYVPEGGYGGDPDSATSQRAEAVTTDEGKPAPAKKTAKKSAAKKTAAKKGGK